MAIKPAEEYARGWAEASSHAVREALDHPRNQAQYDWALGFAAENLRKLTRKANSQAIVTLSAALLSEAGLEGAERVLLVPLHEGGLLLRRAMDEDVAGAHARYAAASQPCFPARPAPADLPEIERLCPQRGHTFRTRQQQRVYCEGCKHQRALNSARATWHRRGKLHPSYRQKRKGAGLADLSQARQDESMSLPFGEETHSGSGTARPAEASPLRHGPVRNCLCRCASGIRAVSPNTLAFARIEA